MSFLRNQSSANHLILLLVSVIIVLVLNPVSTDSPTCKNIITVIGAGSTCLSVSSAEYEYSQCEDATPYCNLNPISFKNQASCSSIQHQTQAKTDLPNGSACLSSSQCLSQNCQSSVCTQGALSNGQACNHPQQCSSTTCFNSTCKEPVQFGQVCQAGQCSLSQKCLPRLAYATSGTCQSRITSGSCLYYNQCSDGYYCDSSNNCTSYPTTDPASCTTQFDCPFNKYCNLDSTTCEARISTGSCDLASSSCIRSKYCSLEGQCKDFISGKQCSNNIQCQSGFCNEFCLTMDLTASCGIDQDDFCSGSNYCHPSTPQNVQNANTCQFPIPGSCSSDDECSSSQYCDSSSGCTNLKDTDATCTEDKQCKGLCLNNSCKALGSLSLGEQAGGKYKLCKSGYIPDSSTTCGSLTFASSNFFCDTANKCDYTDSNGSTVQLDCRCGGNGATPALNGHCPHYRGTQIFQKLIQHASELGILKQEHFDNPYALGVPLIGIDLSQNKNIFAGIRYNQVSFSFFFQSENLYAVKNNFQNALAWKSIPQKGLYLLNKKSGVDHYSQKLSPTPEDQTDIFLTEEMIDQEITYQIELFNILYTKEGFTVSNFTSHIETFAQKYLDLSRFTCSNTFKVIQVVARLYRSLMSGGADYSTVDTLFTNLLSKGDGCSQQSQMQVLHAQILSQKVRAQCQKLTFTSSLVSVTDMFLQIPQSQRSNHVEILEKCYGSFIYKSLENFTTQRLLQELGDLSQTKNKCTLNQVTQHVFKAFKPLAQKLSLVKSGQDLSVVSSALKKQAGYTIDFSPYARHSISNQLKVEIQSNPGDSFPVLIIDLAYSKCQNVGTLPVIGCGENNQQSQIWGVKRADASVIAPVNATFSLLNGFQYNLQYEIQYMVEKPSQFKPNCCVRLTSSNVWEKIQSTPIRKSRDKFTCPTNQAGFLSFIYYRESGQACVDLRQALDMEDYKMAADLVEELLRRLCDPYLRDFVSSPGYECSNCYEWSQTSRKAAQILIDQRTEELKLRRQLAISFFYSMICRCRSRSITHSQRIQVMNNICFFLRQIYFSFMRQYRWLVAKDDTRNLNEQIVRFLQLSNNQIFEQMGTADLALQSQNFTKQQVFYGDIQALIGGNVPNHLLKNVPSDHLKYLNPNVNSYLILGRDFYNRNKLYQQGQDYGQLHSINKLTVLEPLNDHYVSVQNEYKVLQQYSIMAFSENNKQLANGSLQQAYTFGSRSIKIENDMRYQCVAQSIDEQKKVVYENINTHVDRENNVIQCQSHRIGTIAILGRSVNLIEKATQHIVLIQHGLILLIFTLISLILHQRHQRKTKRIIAKQLASQIPMQIANIKIQSKCYRPHLIYKKYCCLLFCYIIYYANPIFRMFLYFDSIEFGSLLFLTKAAQALMRVSFITFSIFYVKSWAIYLVIVVLATYSYSPLQGLIFWRSFKFNGSEILYIYSKNEKKVHTINKKLAISGIVIAILVSIAAFIISGLQIKGSIVQKQDFTLKVSIPIILLFGFSVVQAIVLNLIYLFKKQALSPKKYVIRKLYEIFVARDVRLIFEDREIMLKEMVANDAVAPQENEIGGIVAIPQEGNDSSQDQNQEEDDKISDEEDNEIPEGMDEVKIPEEDKVEDMEGNQSEGLNYSVINTGRSDAPFNVPPRGHQRFKTSMN